ncbi:MAG: transposase [Prevotella sp.]|nr:transposase [Prevotella sp.]
MTIYVVSNPEIINSDQGVEYTTKRWENLLHGHNIQISMDGRERCKDNIWIESFWRTIKQEYIYLNPTDNVEGLRKGISEFIKFYNYQRPHQSMESCCPAWNRVFSYKKKTKCFIV